MVPQLLPQDCNHLEESLQRDFNARQKRLARSPCVSDDFLSVDNPVLHQGSSHASSSVRSRPLRHRHLAHEHRAPTAVSVRSSNSGEQSSCCTNFLAQTRVEQEARDHISNSSPVGSHAKSETNAELCRRQHSVATRPYDWFLLWPNAPRAPGDIAGRDEFCCPRTLVAATHCGRMGQTETNCLFSVGPTLVSHCGTLVANERLPWFDQSLKKWSRCGEILLQWS